MSVSVVASVESVSSAPMWRAPSAVAVSQGTDQTPTRTWNVSVRTEVAKHQTETKESKIYLRAINFSSIGYSLDFNYRRLVSSSKWLKIYSKTKKFNLMK